MKEVIEISIPTEWKDVSLQNYLDLQIALEGYKDEEEAHMGLMLHHLCGINFDIQRNLSVKTMNELKSKLSGFQKPEDLPLQRFITIDGVEYGFEPNLSKMAYGAYVDISQYESLTIDKNWSKVMSVLYRPVTTKKGELYQIQPYTGEEDHKKFLWINMDVHFGCMFFFIILWRDLLHATLNSLTEMEVPANIKSILAKNGRAIHQSLSLQEEIWKGWKK